MAKPRKQKSIFVLFWFFAKMEHREKSFLAKSKGNINSLLASNCMSSPHSSPHRTASCDITYHGVHGEVVVLSLQLHGVLVTPSDLRVTLQEHFLVVADPVEHLPTHNTHNTAASLTSPVTDCLLWNTLQRNKSYTSFFKRSALKTFRQI